MATGVFTWPPSFLRIGVADSLNAQRLGPRGRFPQAPGSQDGYKRGPPRMAILLVPMWEFPKIRGPDIDHPI